MSMNALFDHLLSKTWWIQSLSITNEKSMVVFIYLSLITINKKKDRENSHDNDPWHLFWLVQFSSQYLSLTKSGILKLIYLYQIITLNTLRLFFLFILNISSLEKTNTLVNRTNINLQRIVTAYSLSFSHDDDDKITQLAKWPRFILILFFEILKNLTHMHVVMFFFFFSVKSIRIKTNLNIFSFSNHLKTLPFSELISYFLFLLFFLLLFFVCRSLVFFFFFWCVY